MIYSMKFIFVQRITVHTKMQLIQLFSMIVLLYRVRCEEISRSEQQFQTPKLVFRGNRTLITTTATGNGPLIP